MKFLKRTKTIIIKDLYKCEKCDGYGYTGRGQDDYGCLISYQCHNCRLGYIDKEIERINEESNEQGITFLSKERKESIELKEKALDRLSKKEKEALGL